MTVEIELVRHGKTAGNLDGRYIGRTDEPLCPEGIRELRVGACAASQAWFISPMRRCLETAVLLYGSSAPCPEAIERFLEEGNREIVEDFRECDFGIFENKNYRELSGCSQYQQWIDSNGTLPFPNGEDPAIFRKRCCRAFEQVVDRIWEQDWKQICMVVHGGTIMSIMERYASLRKSYFDWRVENGCGYRLLLDKKRWKEEKLVQWIGNVRNKI